MSTVDPTGPLQQSQQITAPLGCGAMVLREACNDIPRYGPMPQITLLSPADTSVRNEGHSDAIVVNSPASSFELNSAMSRQLYEFLHSYYRRSGKHLTS